MITLSIRYTLDAGKLADFAAYATDLQPAIERCGGTLQGYYLPTNFAGASTTKRSWPKKLSVRLYFSNIDGSAPLYLGAVVRPSGSLEEHALSAGRALTGEANPYAGLLGVIRTPGWSKLIP